MRPVSNKKIWIYDIKTIINNKKIKNDLKKEGIKGSGTSKNRFPTVKLIDFLKRMTEQNKGKQHWAGVPGSHRRRIIDFLIDNTFSDGANGYKSSRSNFINDIGQFCSYCGMRVNDTSLAIEHCLPKSQFPSLMIKSTNLLLACTPCNSLYKGSDPTYAQAMTWTSSTDFAHIVQAAYDHYIWPFNANNNVYQAFQAELYHNGNPIPRYISINFKNTIVGPTTNGVINANLNGKAYNNVKVEIHSTDPKAEQMIDLVGLNDPRSNFPTDRRVENRTIAWFTAISNFHLYNHILTINPPVPNQQKVLDQIFEIILQTASSSGFYSVWITVLLQIVNNDTTNPIYQKFKTDTDGKNRYFPGTVTSLLP